MICLVILEEGDPLGLTVCHRISLPITPSPAFNPEAKLLEEGIVGRDGWET